MPYLLSNLCIANAKVERSKRSRQVIECAGNAGRMHVIFPNKVASLFRHSSVCNASRQQKCTAFPMDWAKHGVKIVHSDELDLNTPQTSGMTRAAAITHARAGASKLWAGTMVVQPDAKTGPHHHGELETVLYVVKGRVRMRWGDQLELSDEARPGDFIYVPPYVPHQEINASPDEICEAVVVRDGEDPIVINLDLHTPEPASAGHRGMPFHPDR